MPDAHKKPAGRIDETRDANTSYILQTKENDLFIRTGTQIIASCQLGISVEVWFDELTSMMAAVRKWASDNSSSVRSCYCVPIGPAVVLFVSPKSACFDFDLADRLAEMNLDWKRSFNVGMVEVHQVPWAELDQFIDPDSTTPVYGEHFKSSQTVEA